MFQTIVRAAAALAVAGAAGSALAAGAADAAYPDRPIHLIVNGAGGSLPDLFARPLAEKLRVSLGQAVVIENRPGAGGIVAMRELQHKPADGYTLALITNAHAVWNPYLFKDLPYDPQKDLQAVAPIATISMAMMVNKDQPVNTLADLVQWSKQNPGKLNYASSGNGTASHLAGAMMQQRTGLDIQHVPYKGAGQAMTDLIAGRVSIMFDQVVSAMPQLQAGGVRALAVVNDQRLASMPDLPTVAEAGLKDFDPTPWVGLCTSPGVPAERVEILQKAVLKALADPEIQKRFVADGLPIVGSTSQEFAAFLARDREKWGGAVKQIKFD